MSIRKILIILLVGVMLTSVLLAEWVDPFQLQRGKVYAISKQTPLSPAFKPKDPIKAFGQIKQMPKKTRFKVLKIKKDPSWGTWYYVEAVGFGRGWINSVALMNQSLEQVN